MTATILFIGVVLFLGRVFSSLFEKTRLPDVLPLMFLGIVLGPATGLVRADSFGQFGQIFTALALIVVLFRSGMNVKILSLRGAVLRGLLLGTVSFVVVMLVMAWAARVFIGLPQLPAFIFGAVLAGNSTAVITPLIRKLKIAPRAKIILFLETNITSVLTIVVALAFLGVSVNGGSLSALDVGVKILRSFGIAFALSVSAGFFWMGVLNRVRGLENAVSLTFAFVLLVYALSELVGGDGAIAVLVFGVVAGNMRVIKHLWLRKWHFQSNGFNPKEKGFFEEVEFIFKTLFFVYMGICMHIGAWHLVFWGAVVAGGKLLVRAPCVNWCVGKKISRSDCSVMLAMCPNGLVSAVLAAMAAQHLPKDGLVLQDVIYAVIFFSVLLSCLMSFRIEKGGLKWIGRTFFVRHPAPEEEQAENTQGL